MSDDQYATLAPSTSECAVCRREVLIGEPLAPYVDPKIDEVRAVCGLCRDRALQRGWQSAGAAIRRRGTTRLRVEPMTPTRRAVTSDTEPAASRPLEPLALVPDPEPAVDVDAPMSPPQVAILERAIGLDAQSLADEQPTLVARLRAQELELERLRREINPARIAEERRRFERQAAELRELRGMLQQRDQQIERLNHARHAETSPMRMSGHALDAFNQSRELERMARIARTLGDPIVNVHDEGPGIPRRVRVTLSWDIAWYEFVVKLDLGAGRASVHETGTGGDPSVLPLERRRANAVWSGSGLKLS